MKKFFALLLVALLVMSMTAAMAAVDTSNWKSTAFNFTPTGEEEGIKKVYTTDTGDVPVETLTFSVESDEGNPDDTKIKISDLETNATTTEYYLTFEFPVYSKVGVYKYTVTEDTGSTQGVDYDDDHAISISVLVIYDYTNNCLKVESFGVTLGKDEEEKDDTLTNEFTTGGDRENGSLKVTKTVTGNLGDKNKEFKMTVTLTTEEGKKVNTPITVSGGSNAANTQTIAGNGWTGSKPVTIYLKDGETVTFDKIPVGVSYKVEESTEYSDDTDINGENGYDAPDYVKNQEGVSTKGTTPTAEVKNNKEGSINTGIILQYAPYIAILAVVLAGAALMIIRRRRNNED